MDSGMNIPIENRAVPWQGSRPPKKILVMRFQALGDTVITLPYLQSLKRQYPEIELHLLTREEVSPIPKSVGLFSTVVTVGGGRNAKRQFLLTLMKVPWLLLQRYDAILDLQNHRISRVVRMLLPVKSFTEFENDRRTKLSAGERTRQAVERLWSWKISLDPDLKIIAPPTNELLIRNGWTPGKALVVLNPAGYCASRNWPLENYVQFAERWLIANPMTQFVLLLLPAHRATADYIKGKMGTHCIDLTGKADQLQAFSIIRQSSFVLSEDSGLMHMAWVQGIPTIALFSSSRKDWSAPQGEWSYCFDSADLECGPCMLEVCRYGDNRCLTRYTGEIVFKKAMELHGKK